MSRNEKALQTLEDYRNPGDAIYELKRRDTAPWWKYVLDFVLLDGVFYFNRNRMTNVVMPFYLVATDSDGTILQIDNGRVADTIPIPEWDPAMKENFQSVTVDGFTYRRAARLT